MSSGLLGARFSVNTASVSPRGTLLHGSPKRLDPSRAASTRDRVPVHARHDPRVGRRKTRVRAWCEGESGGGESRHEHTESPWRTAKEERNEEDADDVACTGALGAGTRGVSGWSPAEEATMRPPQRPRRRPRMMGPRVAHSPPIASPAAPICAGGSRWLMAAFRVAWRDAWCTAWRTRGSRMAGFAPEGIRLCGALAKPRKGSGHPCARPYFVGGKPPHRPSPSLRLTKSPNSPPTTSPAAPLAATMTPPGSWRWLKATFRVA